MAKYTAISQVPRSWRKIGHGQLQLAHIQKLVDVAEAESEKTGEPFAVTHGRARAEFERRNEFVNGFWVEKGGDK